MKVGDLVRCAYDKNKYRTGVILRIARPDQYGSFGDVASTSFFPAKPLGCYGDGGAIFTNDDDIAKKMISLPIYPELKDIELNYIVDQFNNIYKNLRIEKV